MPGDLRWINDSVGTVVGSLVNEMGNCYVISGEGRGVELIAWDLVGCSHLEIVDRKVERDDELGDEGVGLEKMKEEEERYEEVDY